MEGHWLSPIRIVRDMPQETKATPLIFISEMFLKVNRTLGLHTILVGSTEPSISNWYMFVMVRFTLRVWLPGKNCSVRFEPLAQNLVHTQRGCSMAAWSTTCYLVLASGGLFLQLSVRGGPVEPWSGPGWSPSCGMALQGEELLGGKKGQVQTLIILKLVNRVYCAGI